MTIKEIMELSARDLNKLSERELTKVTQRLVDASNKRLRRLEEKGLTVQSTAYGSARITRKTEPRFSTRTRTKKFRMEELKNVFYRTKSFLQAKTSTIRGTREYQKQIEDSMSFIEYFYFKNGKPKKGKLTNFWNAYNKYKEELANKNPDLYSKTYSTGSPVKAMEAFFEDVFKKKATKKGRLKITDIEKSVIESYERGEKISHAEEREDGMEIPSKGRRVAPRVDSPSGKKRK